MRINRYENLVNTPKPERLNDDVYLSRVGAEAIETARLLSQLTTEQNSLDEDYFAKVDSEDESVYESVKKDGVIRKEVMTRGQFEYNGRLQKAKLYNGIIGDESRDKLKGVTLTNRDAEYVRRRKRRIEEDREAERRRDKNKAKAEETAQFWDKSLESLMYVMSDRGIFDSEARNGKLKYLAEPIWTSEYDDFAHGIDCAFAIPCQDRNGNVRYVPIAIDCGSGSSPNITNKLFEKGDDRRPDESKPHIWTEARYAVDAGGRVLANGNSKPLPMMSFVIGLDRVTMEEDILAGQEINNLGVDVKTAIYAQLRNQAIMKWKYVKPRLDDLQTREERGILSPSEKVELDDCRRLRQDIAAIYDHFNAQLGQLGLNEKGEPVHDRILTRRGTAQSYLWQKLSTINEKRN